MTEKELLEKVFYFVGPYNWGIKGWLPERFGDFLEAYCVDIVDHTGHFYYPNLRLVQVRGAEGFFGEDDEYDGYVQLDIWDGFSKPLFGALYFRDGKPFDLEIYEAGC